MSGKQSRLRPGKAERAALRREDPKDPGNVPLTVRMILAEREACAKIVAHNASVWMNSAKRMRESGENEIANQHEIRGKVLMESVQDIMRRMHPMDKGKPK